MEEIQMHTLLSVLTTATGMVLMIYMIRTEGEPGAIPLVVVVLGIGWYFTTRSRFRSHPEDARQAVESPRDVGLESIGPKSSGKSIMQPAIEEGRMCSGGGWQDGKWFQETA